VRIHRISDLSREEVEAGTYDVGVFASGYEERAAHVARVLRRDRIQAPVVIGFRQMSQHPQREANRIYFEEAWGGEKLEMGAEEDEQLYALLRALVDRGKSEIRVIIDYSSMSRMWYAAVLNWARYWARADKVYLDFVYAVGDHRDQVLPRVTGDVIPIPGCEGLGTQLSRAVGVFGLGFDGVATLSVLDMLEPDIAYGYLAAPGAFPNYPARAREENAEFILKHSRETLELPLQSVERTFSHLAELVAPHLGEDDVSLIPMGPKPHVLAAILLAMRFERISCLRVGIRRHRTEAVGTSGELVSTRVEFRP
jgi:hypothetical protein